MMQIVDNNNKTEYLTTARSGGSSYRRLPFVDRDKHGSASVMSSPRKVFQEIFSSANRARTHDR
jgi:hypothetical protein